MTEPLPVAEAEEEQERARLSAHRECCPALSSCRSHGKIRRQPRPGYYPTGFSPFLMAKAPGQHFCIALSRRETKADFNSIFAEYDRTFVSSYFDELVPSHVNAVHVVDSGIFAPPHIAAAIGAMLEHSEKSEPHRSDDTDHDVFLHDVFPHDAMAQMVASDDEACLKSRGLPLTDSYTSVPPLKKHSSALELSALALFEAFKTKPSFIHAVYAEEHHVASPSRRRPHECFAEESPHRSFVAEAVCDVTIDEMPTVDRLVKPTVSSENSLAGGRVKRKSAHDTSGSQLARVLQTHKSYHAVRAPKRARGGALDLPTMST